MTEQASRLLLGAGLPVTAGVPSAWRVQEELLLKLAQAQGEAPEDPFACYHKKYRKHSKYSDLLEDVTHSQSERRSSLEGFFEPTAEESEQGLKQPTLAHRAIARLVDRGLVRVILTTNFDRLIDNAIHKETGKRATLVASPSEIRGMSPLHTQDCLVVHLHDQYRNPAGMLNTAEELEAYPSEVEDVLDEIFPKEVRSFR